MEPAQPVAEAAASITQEQLLDTLRRLVERESPSTDLPAVARSADLVAELGARILGATPQRVLRDGRSHVVWRFGGPVRVLLVAHHDTVWPLGTLERRPFAVMDGVVTGPGCFDMKAGLAMALHALADLPDRAGVTLLVTGDEELGSPSSRSLIETEAEGARAALVLEASADGALKTARKGVSLYEIAVEGRAAHAGLEPERGANTTVELATLTLAIAALGSATEGTTVTPTLAESGTTTNTVPAAARLWVDVRARTSAELERVDRAVRSYAPAVEGTRIRVAGGINRPPLEEASSAELFARAGRVAERLGLPAPRGIAVGGASDGNFTAGMGVPTLDGLGAVGDGAHAEHEHVVVAELEPRTRLLRELIADILREDDPWHA
ncbi:M20 family metallopeptidase [Microbacterium sp. RD1]|uniref:M20 family metallopeptidase n=1 Tax=Microbacterium sp. RD1 TaxID=3457313 RepID=UPI003FA5B1E1